MKQYTNSNAWLLMVQIRNFPVISFTYYYHGSAQSNASLDSNSIVPYKKVVRLQKLYPYIFTRRGTVQLTTNERSPPNVTHGVDT